MADSHQLQALLQTYPVLRTIHFLLIAIAVLISSPSFAVAPIILYEKSESQLITNSALMFIDRGSQLSVDDIQRPDVQHQFTSRHTDAYLISDTQSTYWIRFNLFNSLSTTQSIVISLSNNFLGELTLYRLGSEKGNLDQEYPQPQNIPFVEAEAEHFHASFAQANGWLVELPAKAPQEFLVSIKPEIQTSTSVRVQTLDRFVESEQLTGNLAGLLAGGLLAMAIFCFYSYARQRQVFAFFAGAYCTSSAAFVMQLLGYSAVYWGLSAGESIFLLRVTILISLAALLGFLFNAPWTAGLEAAKTRKRIKILSGSVLVATILSLVASPDSAAAIHTQLIIGISGFILIPLLWEVRTSPVNARIWILATVVITALAPIFSALASGTLMGSNLIPSPWTTLLSPIIVASSMMMTLLSTHRSLDVSAYKHKGGLSISPAILAQISHQLRSPINGIQGMNELLNDTPLTDDQKNFSATIRRSSREVLHVADEISHLAKLNESSPYHAHKDLNLGQLLDTMVEHYQADAASKDVELIVDRYEFQQQQLLVDRSRAPTLLHNLLGYLLGYIEQGEIALHLTAVSGRNGEPGMACIQFQLIGEISNREQLRHTLQDLNVPASAHGQGIIWSNLVSSNLMQALGANLEVESLNNTGGSLSLYLPVTLQREIPTTQQASDDTLLGLSVLIVDDNASLRDVVEKQVSRWGIQSHTTHSGKDALAMMRNQCALQQPFDVAIIDQQMPIMDGLELAKRIAEDNGINPKPSILMLTGLNISSVAAKAEERGIKHILSKPAKAEQLKQELLKIRVRS